MKILVNATPLLSEMAGIGYYVYHLTRGLLETDTENQYTFLRHMRFSEDLPAPARAGEGEAGWGRGRIGRELKSLLLAHPPTAAAARAAKEVVRTVLSWRRSFDLYFEPNFIPAPVRSRKLVTTVHDLSCHFHPDWHPRERIDHFNRHFYKRIHRSDVVVTVSHFVKKECEEVLDLREDRVRAIHSGCDGSHFRIRDSAEVRAFRERFALPREFLLFVGSIEPRKNLEALLRAYRMLPSHLRKEVKVVLVGGAGWQNERIRSLAEEMKGDVHYLGYLDVSDLALAYNAARAFVYPSLYEGFGFPPLEAMNCGCPVVASRAASLPEVCGDAARYVDPQDEESIADGMERVLADETLRADLREKGLKRAGEFTWERTAREYLALFQEVAGS